MVTKTIDIRPATSADITAIVGLYYALSQEDAGQRDPFADLAWAERHSSEHFGQLVAGEHSVCLLAQDGDTAIGYLAGYIYGPGDFRPIKVAELESMFVRPEWRSQQLGARLVDMFTAWARQQNAMRMRVTAYANNHRAIAFYRRVGFAPYQQTFERPLV
jgi:GNAT superfamily N-acetyltransferase